MNITTYNQAFVNWLRRELGTRAVNTITFDADFVTGNIIQATVNGDAIPDTNFNTDQTVTLLDFADNLLRSPYVLKVQVTGARQVTVTALNTGVDLVNLVTVIGGASQPVATDAILTSAVPVTVILANQNAPRPNYPYATVRIDTIGVEGQDETTPLDPDTNIASVIGRRTLSVSIDFFGNNHMSQAQAAHISLQKQSIRNLFEAAGIAIYNVNPIQNVTAMLETLWEQHSNFDLIVGVFDEVDDNLGIIERAELEGTIYDSGDEIAQTYGPEIIGE